MWCVRALAYTKPESFLSFFFAVFYVREQYVSTTCKRKQFSVHSHFGANNSSEHHGYLLVHTGVIIFT